MKEFLPAISKKVYSKDIQSARDLFEQGKFTRVHDLMLPLAKKGDADAQCLMALLAQRGLGGMKRDFTGANDWLRLAAQKNHAGAQFELGKAYDEGIGVEPDYKEAVRWYRLAAEQGHASAELAMSYQAFAPKRTGGLENEVEGFKWCKRAASHGSRAANLMFADMLIRGTGCKPNPKEAILLLEKMANEPQPSETAEWELVQVYTSMKKWGVTPDRTKAIYWFARLTQEIDPFAKKLVARPRNKPMTQSELKEASAWFDRGMKQREQEKSYAYDLLHRK